MSDKNLSDVSQNIIPIEGSYGINTVAERELLYSFISKLPNNSVIVEVGTALGGTACIMAATNPTITINCVDSFEGTVGYDYHWTPRRIHKTHNLTELDIIIDNCFSIDMSGKLAFETLTRNFPNIKLWQGQSPIDFLNWDTKIDVYFEDATHQNPTLHTNIDFWCRHIKPAGYIIGHDYSLQNPDVIIEFNKLIADGWTLITKIDRIIILQKPE
jgi:hypothetical protein